MNISGYNAASSIYSYRAEKAQPADFNLPSAPAPSNPQNDNAIKFIESEEEEDEKDKNDGMVDYLLKALEGKEKELNMNANSYIDKLEYLKIHFKDFMNSVSLPQ